jgi:hypothetical protein
MGNDRGNATYTYFDTLSPSASSNGKKTNSVFGEEKCAGNEDDWLCLLQGGKEEERDSILIVNRAPS